MNNCLVTKLNVAIHGNTNSERFNTLQLYTQKSNQARTTLYFYVVSPSNNRVYISPQTDENYLGLRISDKSAETFDKLDNPTTNNQLMLSSNQYDTTIYVTNKSEITKVNCGYVSFNSKDFKYIPHLTEISTLGNLFGTINIEDFAYNIKLKTLSIQYTTTATGSIDKLAQLQVSNGRTDGTLIVNKLSSNLIQCSINATRIKITFDQSFENGYIIEEYITS